MRKRMEIVTFFALALAAAAPAAAQAPAGEPVDLSVGQMVFDSQGNQIGAIESRTGTNVIIALDGGPIALPAASFGKGEKGPILSVTRADLVAARDKMAGEQTAALNAALTIGADVRGAKGAAILGKVKLVEASDIVITTADGDVKIPRSAFFMSPSGLAMNYTPDQFAAVMTQVRESSAARDSAIASALQPGAEVRSIKGSVVLGTVKSFDAGQVVVATSGGDVSIARSAFTMSPQGLAAAYTADQFADAVAKTGGKAVGAPPPSVDKPAG
jgi:hypothetical protein